MSPEERKSELRQIDTAQRAEAHLTAVSKQVSDGFGILGAAMRKIGTLSELELPATHNSAICVASFHGATIYCRSLLVYNSFDIERAM